VDDPTLGSGAARIDVSSAAKQSGAAPLSSAVNFKYTEHYRLLLQRVIAGLSQAATMAGLACPKTLCLDSDSVDEITAAVNRHEIHMLSFLVSADGEMLCYVQDHVAPFVVFLISRVCHRFQSTRIQDRQHVS
jgi:hypothetical protein